MFAECCFNEAKDRSQLTFTASKNFDEDVALDWAKPPAASTERPPASKGALEPKQATAHAPVKQAAARAPVAEDKVLTAVVAELARQASPPAGVGALEPRQAKAQAPARQAAARAPPTEDKALADVAAEPAAGEALYSAEIRDIAVVTNSGLSSRHTEEEMRQLVRQFAKSAVMGCPCTCVCEGSAKLVRTRYRISQSLEHLIILEPDDFSKAEITCRIDDIHDIYSIAEDGEACFPAKVLKALKPEELKRLLMVCYRGGSRTTLRFLLLVENAEECDRFLESMRILCMFAILQRSRTRVNFPDASDP